MVNVLITSAGRRGYLIEWFLEAAQLTGIPATIFAGDANPDAPALKLADHAMKLPPIQSPDYVSTILNICREKHIDLIFALHDYDIAVLSEYALDTLKAAGVTAMIPPISTVTTVTDKLAMCEALAVAGVPTPITTTGTNAASENRFDSVVVKHRFGSASSGVLLVPYQYLPEAVTISSINAPSKHGQIPSTPDPELVIVQEKIDGQEFGLDIVCDQYGDFHGVLARKKLGMRAGETDRAETVDAEPFRGLARQVSSAIALRGNTDIDVMVTNRGEMYVIDINPRFGGGYPFCHVAGANVPACYLTWAEGREIVPDWLTPRRGVIGSKQASVSVISVSGKDRENG